MPASTRVKVGIILLGLIALIALQLSRCEHEEDEEEKEKEEYGAKGDLNSPKEATTTEEILLMEDQLPMENEARKILILASDKWDT